MTEIFEILNKIGYINLADSGQCWRTNPLYRSYRSQNNLVIKKTTGQWYDHSERVGGGLHSLIQKTLKLSNIEETKKYIGELPIIQQRDAIELCETKKFDKSLLYKLDRDNSYWNNRGVSDWIIEKFNGGVAHNGRMKGRYVFPIFDEKNDLIGFSGRLIEKNDNLPKWKHLGQKKNFLFPSFSKEFILKEKTVILIESIGDCLKLSECGVNNTMVSFGVDLSPKIIQQLLKLDVQKILISLNNDEDNGFVGNLAAEEYKNELKNYFDEAQITIALPSAKDFGEMTCEQINLWKTQYLS